MAQYFKREPHHRRTESSEEGLVIMEAKRLQEDDVRHSFKRGAAAWSLTEKRMEFVSEKMWNWAQSNDTRSKNLVHDWDAITTLASDNGRKT